MATADDTPDPIELEQDDTTDAPEEGEQDAAAPEGDQAEGGEAEGDGEAEELVVSIGEAEGDGEEDEAAASPVIRDIRKAQREAVRALRQRERENAELKAELQRLKGGGPEDQPLGARPTLESCGYDEDKFAAELESWHDRKRQQEEQRRQREESERQAQARWQSRVEAVNKAGSGLKVKDQEEALASFEDAFSVVQRGIVLDLTEDPKDAALLRYALGKNPEVAKKLAAIDNPVRFAGAVAKILYKDLNVKPRKAAPPPDRQVRSSVAGAAAVDSTLARLQAEADKTGDRSKVAKYLREKQRAALAA